jgi:hypothetical protein
MIKGNGFCGQNDRAYYIRGEADENQKVVTQ